MGVTPPDIGLTVVAFGTGSREMIVSLEAALGGNGELALGNIVLNWAWSPCSDPFRPPA